MQFSDRYNYFWLHALFWMYIIVIIMYNPCLLQFVYTMSSVYFIVIIGTINKGITNNYHEFVFDISLIKLQKHYAIQHLEI